MIAAEIHNGHDCHHQVQSRRVILTTGNETSTHLCLVLPFDPVPKTLKLPRYRPKCPAKNDITLLFSCYKFLSSDPEKWRTDCHLPATEQGKWDEMIA